MDEYHQERLNVMEQRERNIHENNEFPIHKEVYYPQLERIPEEVYSSEQARTGNKSSTQNLHTDDDRKELLRITIDMNQSLPRNSNPAEPNHLEHQSQNS